MQGQANKSSSERQSTLRTFTPAQLNRIDFMYAETTDAELLEAALAVEANAQADDAAEELAMNNLEWACNSEE